MTSSPVTPPDTPAPDISPTLARIAQAARTFGVAVGPREGCLVCAARPCTHGLTMRRATYQLEIWEVPSDGVWRDRESWRLRLDGGCKTLTRAWVTHGDHDALHALALAMLERMTDGGAR